MIQIKHLQKKFDNLEVLSDVNLNIKCGEVISIIGPSGTGKSTFLRCLNLLEQPTGGSIVIDGEEVLNGKINASRLRQKMGMVFQSFNLFNHLSVLDNVCIGPVKLLGKSRKEAEAKAKELLKMVGMAEKAHAMPSELSGGQKQRAAIARMLTQNTPIMIFDDSLSAVDAETDAKIRKAIETRFGSASIILISHRITTLSKADQIIVLDKGCIAEMGTPAELEKAGGLYQKIYEIQSLSKEEVEA